MSAISEPDRTCPRCGKKFWIRNPSPMAEPERDRGDPRMIRVDDQTAQLMRAIDYAVHLLEHLMGGPHRKVSVV